MVVEADGNGPAAPATSGDDGGARTAEGVQGPALPQTGDRRVDEALEALSEVRSAPLSEQVERYATVHRTLQDRLADLDG
ncbi:hypothetical protein [Angustibacter aerolatus]